MEAAASPSKMAVVLTENAADKLIPFATLVSGAVAMGLEVHVFASFWGLDAFRKETQGTPPSASPGHGEAGTKLEHTLVNRKVPSWRTTLGVAKQLGKLHIYACSQSMDIFALKPSDLDPLVDEVVGVATFIDRTRDAEVSYFI